MENFGLIPVFLCILFCLLDVSGMVSVWDELKPEAGFTGMVAKTYILETLSYGLSLPSCYHACLANSSCMSLFYNRASQNCQLQLNSFLTNRTLVASTGFEYYIVNGDPRCSKKDGFLMNRKLGVCFSVFEMKPFTTMEERRSVCSSVNSRLMSVESPEKDAMMHSVVRTGIIDRAICIGLTRPNPNTLTWTWETGKTLAWNNWRPLEPKNTLPDLCVYDILIGWDDAGCTQGYAHFIVCEKF